MLDIKTSHSRVVKLFNAVMEKKGSPGTLHARFIATPTQPRSRIRASISQGTKLPALEGTRLNLTGEQASVVADDMFDQFIDGLSHLLVNESLESMIKSLFRCDEALLWVDLPEEKCFGSQTAEAKIPYENTLHGSVYKERRLRQTRDGNVSRLVFPLVFGGATKALVEVARGWEFSETEIEFVNVIMKKFEVYGPTIFATSDLARVALELYSVRGVDPLLCVKNYFHCKRCELWRVDTERSTGQRTVDGSADTKTFDMKASGVVGRAVIGKRPINAPDVREYEGYDALVDGEGGPVCMVMQRLSRRDVWMIVLRGREIQFSTQDSVELKALFPFVIGVYSGFDIASEQGMYFMQLADMMTCGCELMKAGSNVIGMIQAQCTRLFECHRCGVFTVSKDREELKGYYSTTQKRFSISKGLVGYAARSGDTIAAANPRDLSFFDPTYDADPQYPVGSILVAPIKNDKEEVVGVLALLSKMGHDAFTESDKKIVDQFTKFVAIALANSKKYRRENGLSRKLKRFLQLVGRKTKKTRIKAVLEDAFNDARRAIEARRVTFFTNDIASNELSVLVNVGQENEFGLVFADAVKDAKHAILVRSAEVEEKAKELKIQLKLPDNEMKLNRGVGSLKGTRSVGVFSKLSPLNQTSETKVYVYGIPCFSRGGSLLGVLEVMCLGDGPKNDIMDWFAMAATLSMDKLNVEEMASRDFGELEVCDWMSDDERALTGVPAKLSLEKDTVDNFDGISSFKLIFHIFEHFGLFRAFQIRAETFFIFLVKLRRLHRKSARHSWKHAVSTTQFVYSQLVTGGLDKSFTQLDIFSLLVAALCHDVDHEGFPDDDAESENAAFGSLLKLQSPLESHHCAVTIDLLSEPECNIFQNIPETESTALWGRILDLILATDMSQHYTIIKSMQKSLETQESDNLILMKCLLKVADLSSVIRPKNSPQWSLDITDEFFHQSDLSQTPELVFTSDKKDYTSLDRDASLMAFLKNACLPLLRVVSQACPPLAMNAEVLKTNIQLWAHSTDQAIPMLDT